MHVYVYMYIYVFVKVLPHFTHKTIYVLSKAVPQVGQTSHRSSSRSRRSLRWGWHMPLLTLWRHDLQGQ